MPGYASQEALRSLANSAGSELTTAGDIMKAHPLAVGAAAVAVAGIAEICSQVSSQLSEVKNQRTAFLKERASGIASFIIPKDYDESDLSKEEKFIQAFIKLSKENPACSTYFGQQHTMLDEGTFYSVLPFYGMRDNQDSRVSNRPIDKQRRDINRFLNLAIPELLSDIDKAFHKESKILSYAKGIWQGKNYMNDHRAARFMVMSLANMIWNLQHPVDPATGYPLTLEASIDVCLYIELYLGTILDSADKEKHRPYLKNICENQPGLTDFVRQITTYTITLRKAYTDELLHNVNIEEVINNAHQALEVFDKSIFNLIYDRRHPETNETDDNAAEILVCMVDYLHELFKICPDLFHYFDDIKKVDDPAKTGRNAVASTVIDALIIFCHLSKTDRIHFISRLHKTKLPYEIGFAQKLSAFDEQFIDPVYKKIKNKLARDKSKLERTELTARHLIPFITLILEDFNVDVDANIVQEGILTSEQQITSINKRAASTDPDAYYEWTLAPFVDMKTSSVKALNQMIKQEYRLTQVTQLLDAFGAFILEYRDFLQHPAFQKPLLKSLEKIETEYTALDKCIKRVRMEFADDQRMPINLKKLLCAVAQDMSNRLAAFSAAWGAFNKTVGSVAFPDQQKRLLTENIGKIDDLYFSLLNERSGLNALLPSSSSATQTPPEMIPNSTTPAAPQANKVAANKIIALSQLAHSCFAGLSYLSQYGHKGVILRDLMNKIDQQTDFTEAQFKLAVKELVRVAASYSETSFFQAAYGQTRSANILIRAIKDPKLHATLPLGSLIFGTTDVNYAEQRDDQIIQALVALRNDERWQTSCSRITATSEFAM